MPSEEYTSTIQNKSNEDTGLTVEKLKEVHNFLKNKDKERRKILEDAMKAGFKVAINPLIKDPFILFPKEYENTLTELMKGKEDG